MLIDSQEFIQFCIEEKQKSEIRLKSYLRADGVAKKGCAIGVNGSGDAIRGYELSISNMNRFVSKIENNKVENDNFMVQ